MAVNGFEPSAYTSVSAVNGTPGAVAVPGSSPTNILIVNLGAATAIVLLTTSEELALDVSISNGVAIVPGQSLLLAVSSNTWLGYLGVGFGNAQLNISVGT